VRHGPDLHLWHVLGGDLQPLPRVPAQVSRRGALPSRDLDCLAGNARANQFARSENGKFNPGFPLSSARTARRKSAV